MHFLLNVAFAALNSHFFWSPGHIKLDSNNCPSNSGGVEYERKSYR